MPSVEHEAERLRQKNGLRAPKNKTWPPLEPVKPFLIRQFRLSLLRKLKVLAARMDKGLTETANLVIEAGAQAVDNELKDDDV